MVLGVLFGLNLLAGQAAAPSANPTPKGQDWSDPGLLQSSQQRPAVEVALRPLRSQGPERGTWRGWLVPAGRRLEGPTVECSLRIVSAHPDVDPDLIRPADPGVDSEMIRPSRCSR
jgi:hypothetical protein